MNGKKSRILRQQAGGNQSQHKFNEKTGLVSLTHSCSRKKYKDLKDLYRLIGV